MLPRLRRSLLRKIRRMRSQLKRRES